MHEMHALQNMSLTIEVKSSAVVEFFELKFHFRSEIF